MATNTATAASLSSSLSSLSLQTPRFSLFPKYTSLLSLSDSKPPVLSLSSNPTKISAKRDDIDFFDELNPEEEFTFDPPEKPEWFEPMRCIDEPPFMSEEEVAKAYEERYGRPYGGGNDIIDALLENSLPQNETKIEKIRDGLEENVVQIRRVTKVVKGGKQLKFRAIVVVGDKNGTVGVGVSKGNEVITAVQRAAIDARRHIVTVPMTKYLTFPHRAQAKYGAASVMLRPAAPGTGVIAGGSVRIVLEMAGLENALGKQLGSDNALNNARATVRAIQSMKQFSDVARERGIPMEELWK